MNLHTKYQIASLAFFFILALTPSLAIAHPAGFYDSLIVCFAPFFAALAVFFMFIFSIVAIYKKAKQTPLSQSLWIVAIIISNLLFLTPVFIIYQESYFIKYTLFHIITFSVLFVPNMIAYHFSTNSLSKNMPISKTHCAVCFACAGIISFFLFIALFALCLYFYSSI